MEKIKDALSFIISLANAVDKSLADGRVSIGDVPLFIEPITHAQAAFSGLGEIKHELESMDEMKRAELVEWAKNEFDLANDKIEHIIENGLSVVLSLANLVLKIKV